MTVSSLTVTRCVLAQAAKAQAQAEGLTLLPAGRVDNTTGYSGVKFLTDCARRTPFRATAPRGKLLGGFATAEEAALAIARELLKHQVPAPPPPPPKKRKVSQTAASRKSSGHS